MESKGYVKNEVMTQQQERECMESKGYEWK